MAKAEKADQDVVTLEQNENAADAKDANMARQAADQEHAITFSQAIRKYPKAVL